MATIRGCDVKIGDTVDYHGERHLVRRIERRAGWAWPVAFDHTGWAIPLGDEGVVHRAA